MYGNVFRIDTRKIDTHNVVILFAVSLHPRYPGACRRLSTSEEATEQIVDIAVPRDAEPKVGKIDGVEAYTTGEAAATGDPRSSIAARYPSRRHFLAMMADPTYRAALRHRYAGLERTVLLQCGT